MKINYGTPTTSTKKLKKHKVWKRSTLVILGIFFTLQLFTNLSKFREIWWIFLKLTWDYYFEMFFVKIGTVLCIFSIFSRPSIIFCMNISLTILAVFQSRRFTKTFIGFSKSILPTEKGITNLLHYMWRIWFILKKT